MTVVENSLIFDDYFSSHIYMTLAIRLGFQPQVGVIENPSYFMELTFLLIKNVSDNCLTGHDITHPNVLD